MYCFGGNADIGRGYASIGLGLYGHSSIFCSILIWIENFFEKVKSIFNRIEFLTSFPGREETDRQGISVLSISNPKLRASTILGLCYCSLNIKKQKFRN
jgi:hypothetical protein